MSKFTNIPVIWENEAGEVKQLMASGEVWWSTFDSLSGPGEPTEVECTMVTEYPSGTEFTFESDANYEDFFLVKLAAIMDRLRDAEEEALERANKQSGKRARRAIMEGKCR